MVEQPGQCTATHRGGNLVRHLRGVAPDQVVEPEPVAAGLAHQVLPLQVGEPATRLRRRDVEQRGGGVHVDVGTGVHPEKREGRLPFGGQVAVGDRQRGGDAPLTVVEVVQPRRAAVRAQFVQQYRNRRRPAEPHACRGDPDGKWEPSAQVDHAGGLVVITAAHLTAEHAGEQGDRVGRFEWVQRHPLGIVEPAEPATTGDQHQAAGCARQQRPDLGLGGGVVEQDDHAPVGQPAAVERGPVVGVRRFVVRAYLLPSVNVTGSRFP